MRIEITKADAAKLLLGKLEEGVVMGGAYHRPKTDDKDQRCAIGWLMPEENAVYLEAQAGKGEGVYKLARDLCNEEALVTDDDQWFIDAQNITDGAYSPTNLVANLGAHCRAALPSFGYDIGNRRSDPVYAS